MSILIFLVLKFNYPQVQCKLKFSLGSLLFTWGMISIGTLLYWFILFKFRSTSLDLRNTTTTTSTTTTNNHNHNNHNIHNNHNHNHNHNHSNTFSYPSMEEERFQHDCILLRCTTQRWLIASSKARRNMLMYRWFCGAKSIKKKD